MRAHDLRRYIKDTEKMVLPERVALTTQGSAMLRKLPLDDISLCTNTFGAGMLDPVPYGEACFPYAQHVVTTSVPTATTMRTAEDLEQAVTEISATLNAPRR